jgi:hypothetical protein
VVVLWPTRVQGASSAGPTAEGSRVSGFSNAAAAVDTSDGRVSEFSSTDIAEGFWAGSEGYDSMS